MAAFRIVESLNEVKHGQSCFLASPKYDTINQFALQRGEKTLTHRIIETVTHCTHLGPYAGLFAPIPERNRRVLRSLVGMMDHPIGLALIERHLQRIEHQRGAQVVGH